MVHVDCKFVTCDVVLCRGVEAVQDAVEHLQSGRSIGKAYVQVASELPSQLSLTAIV